MHEWGRWRINRILVSVLYYSKATPAIDLHDNVNIVYKADSIGVDSAGNTTLGNISLDEHNPIYGVVQSPKLVISIWYLCN